MRLTIHSYAAGHIAAMCERGGGRGAGGGRLIVSVNQSPLLKCDTIRFDSA